MLPGSSLRIRLPRPTKKRARGSKLAREAPPEEHLLRTQLNLANAENSALRKQLSDHRDGTATQIHALRKQNVSLQARVTTLAHESRVQKTDLDRLAKQNLLDVAALRAEARSLKRHLVDADTKNNIIKSAIKQLTTELTTITALLAAAKQELTVVRREREAALDDACNIQNLLQRERNQHELKQCALHKELIHLRKEIYFSNAVRVEYKTPVKHPSNEGAMHQQHRNHPDDDPLDSDSLSTEILTPRQESTKYHVLFTPQIPMTPIRALDDSEYVVNGDGFDSIRPPAYAVIEFGTPKLQFRMVLNEPFSAWGSAERPTMMYIGFEYPDGTSLCYVPIRHIRLKHPSTRDGTDHTSRDHSLGADYGRDYVHLSLSEVLYLALVEQARQVFSTRYSTETVELPRVSYEQPANNSSRMVSITASMKPDARVEITFDGCTQSTLVSNQLLDMRDDIVGDALLAMRFSKAYPNEAGYMLGFKLHGIFVGTR